MPTSRAIGQSTALVVVMVIIVAAFGGYVIGSVGTQTSTSSSSFQPSTVITTASVVVPATVTGTVTMTKTVTSYGGAYASSTNSSLGLELQLSLNTTLMQTGQSLAFNASVFNIRGTESNVSSASNWPVTQLIMSPCGPTDSPIAFAAIQGYYTLGNISRAPRIEYGPGCTTVMGNVQYYSFQPSSNNASVIGNCLPNPCFTKPVTESNTLYEYWNNGNVVNFTTGIYTLVAGDEWGQMVILHFVVYDTVTGYCCTDPNLSLSTPCSTIVTPNYPPVQRLEKLVESDPEFIAAEHGLNYTIQFSGCGSVYSIGGNIPNGTYVDFQATYMTDRQYTNDCGEVGNFTYYLDVAVPLTETGYNMSAIRITPTNSSEITITCTTTT